MFKLLDPTELSACTEKICHLINGTKYSFEFVLKYLYQLSHEKKVTRLLSLG